MRPEAHRRIPDDDRILPLVNVVFLLLVFFMLAGHLEASDPMPIDPPVAELDGEPPVRDVVVLVDAGGGLALDGTPMEEPQLVAVVAARASGEAPPRVHVKADRAADAAALVGLLETLQATGVARLDLLVTIGAP